jgi:hypothetical protein
MAADKILLKAVFETGTIQLVKGDVETHSFSCPHTFVELIVDGVVAYAWMYEHTHPMNELEAYWRFGQEALRLSEADEDRRGALGIGPMALNYASLFCNIKVK